MNLLMMSRSSFVMGYPLWVCQNDPNTKNVALIWLWFNGGCQPSQMDRSAGPQ